MQCVDAMGCNDVLRMLMLMWVHMQCDVDVDVDVDAMCMCVPRHVLPSICHQSVMSMIL